MSPTKVVSVRLQDDTHEKLQQMAGESGIAIPKLLSKLIEKEAFFRRQKLAYWYGEAGIDPKEINADSKIRSVGFKMEALGFDSNEIEKEMQRLGQQLKAMSTPDSREKAKASGKPLTIMTLP